MTYSKELIILAKSIKKGGFCIASKNLNNYEWVRPVKDSPFSTNDLCNSHNYNYPIEVFSIVEMTFIRKNPKKYQPENEIVDMNLEWNYLGEFNIANLDALIDEKETDFLDKIKNNQIPANLINKLNLKNSLQLIKITKSNGARVFYKEVNYYGRDYYKPRLKFNYKGISYDLAMTVPNIQNSNSFILPRTIENAYITIGIGEKFRRNHYILVVMLTEI